MKITMSKSERCAIRSVKVNMHEGKVWDKCLQQNMIHLIKSTITYTNSQ